MYIFNGYLYSIQHVYVSNSMCLTYIDSVFTNTRHTYGTVFFFNVLVKISLLVLNISYKSV